MISFARLTGVGGSNTPALLAYVTMPIVSSSRRLSMRVKSDSFTSGSFSSLFIEPEVSMRKTRFVGFNSSTLTDLPCNPMRIMCLPSPNLLGATSMAMENGWSSSGSG